MNDLNRPATPDALWLDRADAWAIKPESNPYKTITGGDPDRIRVTPEMSMQMQHWREYIRWGYRTIEEVSGVRKQLCMDVAMGNLITIGRREWAAIELTCTTAIRGKAA